ncbi:MAG: aryl-sulfate sulfotransferase [bacterium]
MKRILPVFLVLTFILLISCNKNEKNYLKNIEIQGSQLVPSFSKEILEYSVTSLNSLKPISISVTPEDDNAKIEFNYKIIDDSKIKIESLDTNKFIEITVTGGNSYKRVYKIRTLPKGFPPITIKEKSTPADGYIFLTNFSLNPAFRTPFGRYSMIVDNDGKPVYYRKAILGSADMKQHPNGTYSFFSGKYIKMPEIFGDFTTLDENLNVSSTFTVEHGYTDMHDFRFMKNGNILMFGVEIVEKDLSVIGGLKNAKIWDYFIEETGPTGKVVKDWRSFDHFKVSDIIENYDLKIPYIEHGANCNSIWIEEDGNVLLSSRKLDEISKIDWKTGKFIWRMGGIKCKNNQFKFVDDPLNGFSHQHSISRVTNGNILMMDNGNYNSKKSGKDNIFFVPQTRIVEYQIDEQNKTAKLVWEYKKPGIFVPIMGSVQRLDNGNTFICWSKDSPCITEVDASGKTVLEIDLPTGFQCFSAYKYKIK